VSRGRLLVKFRVDRPAALKRPHEETVRALAAKHMATAGGGAASNLEEAGAARVGHTALAVEQSSQFVFLKLFKDFPIDVRPHLPSIALDGARLHSHQGPPRTSRS
jgi:hypothetical protein